MFDSTDLRRAFGTYLLALLASLLVAAVVLVPFDAPSEPGSLPRLVSVVAFFATFLFLLAREDVVAYWRYVRDDADD